MFSAASVALICLVHCIGCIELGPYSGPIPVPAPVPPLPVPGPIPPYVPAPVPVPAPAPYPVPVPAPVPQPYPVAVGVPQPYSVAVPVKTVYTENVVVPQLQQVVREGYGLAALPVPPPLPQPGPFVQVSTNGGAFVYPPIAVGPALVPGSVPTFFAYGGKPYPYVDKKGAAAALQKQVKEARS